MLVLASSRGPLAVCAGQLCVRARPRSSLQQSHSLKLAMKRGGALSSPLSPERDRMLTCALCAVQVPKLLNSHLMPAALYKLLRDPEGPGSPDPIIVGGGRSVTSSAQVSQPLLCYDCERRFGRHESWMLRHCARPQTFLLRDGLSGAPSLRLSSRNVLACDINSSYPEAAGHLEYFAASIIWRSAVVSWRIGSRVMRTLQLGPYLEEFRRYLIGEEPFPADAALSVFVDSQPRPSLSLVFPFSGRFGPATRHIFAIPGVRFVLFVGKQLPAENRAMAVNSDGPKVLFLEDFALSSFQQWQLNLVKVSPPVSRLREGFLARIEDRESGI